MPNLDVMLHASRPSRVEPLTPRRRAILAAIAESLRTRRYAPSMRELSACVHIKSHSTISHHLDILERNQFLVVPRLATGEMISHAIQLTDNGWRVAREMQQKQIRQRSTNHAPSQI